MQGKGEKTKGYNPAAVEPAVEDLWLREGLFAPRPAKDAYCIVIPPPNVTGSLHMGHAFSYTIQDVLIRHARMQGKETLWQPGTDHAGIATQMVVERLLEREGLSRKALGRDRFLDRVWQWKEKSGDTIVNQLKRLGCSCDWSRLRFTLDEGLSEAVREVFVRLYEEGLIYRGTRLVNWDPVLETAVSDLEVQYEEEQGHLWYIRYPLEEDPQRHVIVATTRPETMLGDAAVAVHPEDDRYRELVGKRVILPLTGRTIPIIADEYVDPSFGTGCVKITPAHDFNDYEVGKRHGLPMINIFDTRAHIVDDEIVPSKYRGMERYEAREHIVADLDAEGLLHRVEEHMHMVGRGDRSHAVLEPYLTEQWFVRIKPLAEEAIKAVEDGRIRFVPEFWTKTYFEWMHNIQDWCISRQLWWGHRIPAWFCLRCNGVTVARTQPECCATCASKEIYQDEDVLDTWFSSALWPFSTLGWPHDTRELARFYPTDVLVTGFDIIFFWVARMIMMGLKFTGEVPFRDVYIHALIRDAQGQKMSKSKGNVIDPLVMIERYGADALRFTLVSMATPGRDVKLDEDRIAASRLFMNKIWNAARFVFMNRGEMKPGGRLDPQMDLNRWIVHKFRGLLQDLDEALASYRFNEAAAALYAFIWGTFCDWYVEAAKVYLYGGDAQAKTETQETMLAVFDGWLRLLHPLCPHITEALWQELHGPSARLVIASWPDPKDWPMTDEHAASRMEKVCQIVTAIRSMRGEMRIPPGLKMEASFSCSTALKNELQPMEALIKALARLTRFHWVGEGESLAQSAVYPVAGGTLYLHLAGVVDIRAERARLAKAKAKLDKEIARLESRLGNPAFRKKAPPEVVKKVEEQLAEFIAKRGEIEKAAERLAD